MHKNIVFDCGNVIFKWDRYQVLKKYIDDDFLISQYIEVIFENWHKKDEGMTKDEYYELTIKKLPKELHEPFKRFSDTWANNIEPIREIHELIIKLKKDHSIYLLSNISPEYIDVYNSKEIFRYFDGYVISGLVKMVKPNKEIYELLLNTYNLNPKSSLFIDDKLENLEAAKAIGFDVFQFDFNNFKALEDFLKNNNDI